MALLYQVPTQNSLQLTLDAQLSAGGGTLTLNQSVAGIVQAPGICWIDRIDSSGNKTPTKREYISFTGVSGTQLTGLTRGLAGSTDQVHAVGAIVEFGPDVVHYQSLYDVFTAEHSARGQHTSLASLAMARTYALTVTSNASIQTLNVANLLNASGASLAGFPVRPVWVIPGTASAATTSIGKPIDMPESGTIDWVSVALRSPVSGASLIFDINKNFTSIFDAGTRPSILSGGTFVSTASIATKTFLRGNVFSVDLDAGGWFVDATVKFSAR